MTARYAKCIILSNWCKRYEEDLAIEIGKSNDHQISYAISKNATTDTIIFDEWIGISTDKLLYRYIFKWFGNGPRANDGNNIAIGIVTIDYDSKSMIGFCPNSYSWYYQYHIDSFMIHNATMININPLPNISLGKNGIKDKLEANEREMKCILKCKSI